MATVQQLEQEIKKLDKRLTAAEAALKRAGLMKKKSSGRRPDPKRERVRPLPV